MQMLKCRDDLAPVSFRADESCSDTAKPFKLTEGSTCSWAKPGECFGTDTLRSRIEPWLTALFQSEHLSVLIGSGLTHALHRLASGQGLPGMAPQPMPTFEEAIAAEAKRSAEAMGRGTDGNIEDRIRVANELIRGFQIIAATPEGSEQRQQVNDLSKGLTQVLNGFAASILKGEQGLVGASAEKRHSATSSAF